MYEVQVNYVEIASSSLSVTIAINSTHRRGFPHASPELKQTNLVYFLLASYPCDRESVLQTATEALQGRVVLRNL